MKQELMKVLQQERKYKRELAELRALRQKIMAHVNPDQKLLKMIDDEIASLLK